VVNIMFNPNVPTITVRGAWLTFQLRQPLVNCSLANFYNNGCLIDAVESTVAFLMRNFGLSGGRPTVVC
jgi:hypothetical protein